MAEGGADGDGLSGALNPRSESERTDCAQVPRARWAESDGTPEAARRK